MAKLLYLIVLFTIFSNSTEASELRERVEALLPSSLDSIGPKLTRIELEKKFSSSITKKSNNALFLKLGSNRISDVTIGMKKDIFSYLFVDAASDAIKKDTNLFGDIWEKLESQRKKKILANLENETGHDRGLFITIELPEEFMTLKFSNDSKKELATIILYPASKK